METEGTEGVVFPLSADGRRSTSALGRAVVADALRPVDPVGAWLWLAWANGRGYNWARFAFAALFGLLTIGLLFVLAEGGDGQDALPVLLPDLIAAAALWLVALAAMVLIFTETASPYYQRRASNASSNTNERNRTVADQFDSKCLLIPKDWTASDGSGHGRACLLIRGFKFGPFGQAGLV